MKIQIAASLSLHKYLFTLWLLLSPLCVVCQNTQQAALIAAFRKLTTTNQRFDFLADSTITKFDKPNYETILTIIKEKKDDKAAFFWHFQYARFAEHFMIDNEAQLPKIVEQMTKIAQKNELEAERVVAQWFKSLHAFNGKYLSEQQIYSSFLNCFEQIKRVGFNKFQSYTPDGILRVIGCNFYALGDYEKAVECLLEAEKATLAASSINAHNYTMILNTIECAYADTKNYPQAIAYANKVYDLNQNSKYKAAQAWYATFWQGLASLDAAQYLFEMGNYTEGEKYANRGYELYKAHEDFNHTDKVVATYDALQVLIKIKLKLGKVEEVKPLFKKVEFLKTRIDFSKEENYFKPLRQYNNYYKYYETQKDYTNAFRYLKLANEMQDSLNRRNDKRKLWQIESRVKADNYQSQIKSAEADSRLQLQLRNAAILALLLFAGIAFVVYQRIKKDNKTISEQKTLLENSLSEKETLLKEIHHRVKNNLQIISGLLEKQATIAADDITKRLLREGQDRVFSMALVHQNLYQSENLNAIEIKSYLEMLTKHVSQTHSDRDKVIEVNMNVDDSKVNIDTAIPLGLILNELITNAYKYAFEGRKTGIITIGFHQNQKDLHFSVQDNGVGLPLDFDVRRTQSLGMNLVRGLVRQLDGKLDFRSNTEGVVFEVTCPI
jgi:two-component sensor histidine kinase